MSVEHAKIDHLMGHPTLDKDGYPTEEALHMIRNWDLLVPARQLFNHIRSMWHHSSWGWEEYEYQNSRDETVTVIKISTGGWSGNESIIEAMMQNNLLWNIHWCQSRRGGHYTFEMVRKENE